MDIALFDRSKKAFSAQSRSKIRSNPASNVHDKRRPLTNFHHGRPLAYSRASRSRSGPCVGKPTKNMKQILSSWQGHMSRDVSAPSMFQFDDAENEDYVNSRFRFVIRDGPAVDEDGDVPWDRVEHVRVPAFDNHYTCPICLDPPIAARITRCGHIFCLPCILHHLHERPKCKCPLCFAPMVEEELRSMEFVQITAVHVGDQVQMCLLTRIKSHTHPQPADPSRSEIFSRFVKTDSIEEIVQRELRELKSAADSCQCLITAAFIDTAAQNVESRASHWIGDVPEEAPHLIDKSLQEIPSKDIYYFYQTCDGSPIFMHSLNYRALVEEYGNDFPAIICGKVLEVMQYEQNEDNRMRFRFLRHLPLATIFYIVELDINEYLSEETIEKFRFETTKRQLSRDEKERQAELAERRQKRRAELAEIEQQMSPMPLYKYDPYPVPEVGSVESFPSLSFTPPFPYSSSNQPPSGSHRPRWPSPSPQRAPRLLENYPQSEEDNDLESGQLLHSSTPPDWNLIDFQITTRSKQRKQKPKQRKEQTE